MAVGNFNGFYIAKVENVLNDPEKRGRVQLRVQGIHTENTTDDFTGIPTENLPWAEYAAPLFESFGQSGGGVKAIPEVGSFVYCFFINGDFQKPVYFATVTGSSDIPETTEENINIKTITSRGGHIITIDDTEGAESIKIEHSKGSAIVMDMKEDKTRIVIAADEVYLTGKEKTIVGGGTGGYPLLGNSPNTTYTINGMKFTSARTMVK